MKKTLKVGPRPLAIIGGILLPLLAAVYYQAFSGDWSGAARNLGWLSLAAIFLFSQLYFVSIRVDEDKIAIRGWWGEKESVYFRDVTRTQANVLFEKDFPLSIDIFCGSQHVPAMVIRSKSLKKSDIAWLLSLPALRVENGKTPNQPPGPARSCGPRGSS